MAIPSSVYAEDENARQTLANGAVLKWTKQLQNIHALNAVTDLSISYTNWANEPMMTHANRGFHQWQGGCVSGGDLGYNQSTGFTYQHATGIKQLEGGQPRIDSLQTHVVLSNGGGYYVWGYNPESSTRISGNSGDQRRYLLDMDINKMIFNCTITVVDKSFFDNVDYTTNPENMPAPSEHNITLKELYAHPELYYCTGVINWSNTYVYGSDTSDHWRGVAIRPAIILTGETIGEYQGADDTIFGRFNSNGSFSYDSRDPNGHANFGGGGSSNTLYNRMNAGYFMGCKNEIDMTPTDTFDSAGGASISIALGKWGYRNFNKFAYCNGQIFDYGDSVIWCAWGCRVVNNTDTGSIYRDYTFGTRRYIKADKMLKYIASFGLYFMSESFDPDSVNLTPDTLGDDSRIMLGEMSSDGTTTGRWITDIDSYHGPNKDGKTNNPTYDPSGGGGGSSGDDYTDMSLGVANLTLGGLTKYAILSKQNLIDLVIDYNTNLATAGTNFSNHVICLYRLGFGASDLVVTNSEKIKMIQSAGQVDFESSANYSVVTKQTPFIHFGSITVPRHTGTFYDFAPYSSYELYIPGCGWIPLPDNVAGRTLNVYLVFDLPTCSAKGIVRIAGDIYGGTTIATVNGIIGASVPFTIGENGMQRAAILSGSTQTAAALGTAFLGVGTGNLYMGASGVAMAANGIASNYVAGNTNFISTKGGASDFSAFGDGAGAILKCNCPEIDPVVNESMFGHTVGYLCNEVGKLSTFSGFTVCDNPHVTFSATSREREEIELLLSRGVIL